MTTDRIGKKPKLNPHDHASVAARARWGPSRVVKLGDLTNPQRRLVLALIDAARANLPDGTG